MKIIAMIPARYAATRFPAKLMQVLGNKTVIQHTYDNTVATNLFDAVYVVTDSALIFDTITKQGGNAIMSVQPHESGSDRIAEAIVNMDIDVVVNVQGDEPFMHPQSLASLVQAFSTTPNLQVASLMQLITNIADVNNPNCVKVVVDNNSNALLFSRSPIPYYRATDIPQLYYKHIGVYAFAKKALLTFTQLPMSTLEVTEKLENLRYLQNGIAIKMILTPHPTIGIDTPEDLEKARLLL